MYTTYPMPLVHPRISPDPLPECPEDLGCRKESYYRGTDELRIRTMPGMPSLSRNTQRHPQPSSLRECLGRTREPDRGSRWVDNDEYDSADRPD